MILMKTSLKHESTAFYKNYYISRAILKLTPYSFPPKLSDYIWLNKMPLSKRATNITNRFSIKAFLVYFPESEKVMTIISVK